MLEQDFDDWELILVDDCSPDPAVRELLGRLAAGDERVKVVEREVNGHIVAASNDGVAMARGEFIVLLDHDDLLVSEALSRVARARRATTPTPTISTRTRTRSTTTATTTTSSASRSGRPSVYAARCTRVISRCCARRPFAESARFREGYDGSQDHDLVLRVTEVARRVVHIPEVLYHWRTIPGSAAADSNAKPYAAD